VTAIFSILFFLIVISNLFLNKRWRNISIFLKKMIEKKQRFSEQCLKILGMESNVRKTRRTNS
jgi:hypothetical protein